MLYRREDRSGGRGIRSHESVPESHEHQEQRPKTLAVPFMVELSYVTLRQNCTNAASMPYGHGRPAGRLSDS